MKAALLALGGVLLVVGGVWIGQGADFIGGSFMTGQPTWLCIGIAVALLGEGLSGRVFLRTWRFP